MSLELEESKPVGLTVKTYGIDHNEPIRFYVYNHDKGRTTFDFKFDFVDFFELATKYLTEDKIFETLECLEYQGMEFSYNDFHAIIIYALTNTDLSGDDDVRLDFLNTIRNMALPVDNDIRVYIIKWIKTLKIVQGYMSGNIRIGNK